ncbi:hypothetical protein [Natrarchaeobaculum aegyptiacum]|uniref:Uncharacterized protein n=1 Tax=Natrarchaeobaculum aegyptiacum TaxID=745377 RepID=A0A2Z2HW24_9EURY|nr:hypothetical protein [Natrarchaeobaculum aegyptiacum]ARS91420.1 hypothetical protein B1756_17970 [Natrarchaeobaculum aegyptiacum]
MTAIGGVLTSVSVGAQDDPEWPIGPDGDDDRGEWEGEPHPDDPDYDDLEMVTDDTDSIQFAVPTDWDDVDSRPANVGPSIWASPDLEGYLESWEIPGIEVTVTTEDELLETNPDDLLDEFIDYSDDCSDDGRRVTAAGGHAFLAQVWTDCDDLETAYVSMVGAPIAGAGGQFPPHQPPGEMPPGDGPEDGMPPEDMPPWDDPDNGMPRDDMPPWGGDGDGDEDEADGATEEDAADDDNGDVDENDDTDDADWPGPDTDEFPEGSIDDFPPEPPYVVIAGAQLVSDPDAAVLRTALSSLVVDSPDDGS